MKTTKFLLIGLPFLVILLFLGPSVLASYSNTTHVDGYYGDEYPYGATSACHPEISSFDDYVVIVYTYNSGTNAQIRMAYSSNYGWSFTKQLVYNDAEVIQDYADVHIFLDTAKDDEIRAVIVWQEKPDDDSEEWEIKAREWSFRTNTWSTGVKDVSETSYTEDDNDNIYPKVSACSANSESYWNIVWQRDWDGFTDHYGIYLRTYIRTTATENFNNIATLDYPGDNDDNYRHPATDCLPSEDNEDIYVVYDEFHDECDPEYVIKSVYGDLDGGGEFNSGGSCDIEYVDDEDEEILMYPDIAAVGPTSGQGNTVDCVWIRHDGTNEVVRYARSTDGGSQYTVLQTDLDDDGSMELRAVAIDTNISYDAMGIPQYKCHVIWTTGSDVLYIERTGSNGNWGNFGSQQSGATMVGHNENFVDASTSELTPGVIGVYATWQVDGTAVFYGQA